MTVTDQPTELLPALLYESLPKPSPYPFDETPAPVKSTQRHPDPEINLHIPHYPGVAFQAPTPGYSPLPLGARNKAEACPPAHGQARRTPNAHRVRTAAESGDLPRRRHASPPRPEATDPHSPRRTGTLAGMTGVQIRDALVRAASPPATVSLLHPTGEFARRVEAVRRAREAEEAIPEQHRTRPGLAWRLWKFLPVLCLVAKCRSCKHPWPCRILRRHLAFFHPDTVAWQLHRLSSKRMRARAARRNTTTVTHRAKPRRIDRREQGIQPAPTLHG